MITVSLRQAVIPDRLLGRVNSVYRFFGWGAIPIGALLGGVLVAVLDGPLSREWALRMPWIVAGVAQLVLAAVVARTLTQRPHRRGARRRPVEDPVGVTVASAIGRRPATASLEQALSTGPRWSTGSRPGAPRSGSFVCSNVARSR